MTVEGGEVLRHEATLVLAFATGCDHEKVVAKRFSKGVDRLGHGNDLEQNKNIVKC